MKKNPQKLTYISLFSSAGVGCYGFSKQDFDCIATVEIIKRRLDIQKFNNKCIYPSGYIADDITKKSTKEKIFSEINDWKMNKGLEGVDVVIATPPCQGMSVANHKKKNELKRNSLVVESVKLVDDINPKFFIFENVRSFLNTLCTDTDGSERSIQDVINLNLGGKYNIHFEVINFKDYGNPSSRTRTLVIGARKDIPDISPSDLMPSQKKPKSLKDTIGHLPKLKKMGEIHKDDIFHNFREYKEHMLPWIENICEGESAFDNHDPKRRPHQIKDGKIVYNKNKNGDKYSRCYWNKVAPCIHTRNDILASQATIHPSDNRVFSIRELMLMMSVPKSFKWTDVSFEKMNSLSFDEKKKILKEEEINIRQSLGEAVPTVIFESIAKNIKKNLQKSNSSKNETQIKKIISENKLKETENLKKFIKKNLRKYSYSELSKIIELANSQRLKHAAYYTRQDICFSVIKDLPDASQYESLRILEPSVGAGNFLPLLIQKYSSVKKVEIDVIDIDSDILDVLKILLKKIKVPKNIKINYINENFLLYDHTSLFYQVKRYDIVVGNPPFGKPTVSKDLLKFYKENKYNQDTNNLFSFFLEKSLQMADYVGLIIPKSFLSSPEFNKTRQLVSSFALKKVTDYGETAFKGVKIETISIVIDSKKKGVDTIVESYIKNSLELKKQDYICSEEFPYWLLYRNDFFDKVAKRMQFNIFSVYRDRQITKKITNQNSGVRVLKSRNIGFNEIKDLDGYDSYVESLEGLNVSKFMNMEDVVLIPNLTYKPRATFLPPNSIVDGSVAILQKKEDIQISRNDLEYFSSEEFTNFYRVARNHGTRSLNIDNNSVFFFGIKK